MVKQSPELDHTILLGEIFLQNIVATFDYHNSSIQLGVNVHAPTNTLAEVYHKPKDAGWTNTNLLGIAILLFMIIGTILICIICKIRSRKMSEKEIRALAYAMPPSNET